jgi:hypothetical protein
MNGVNLQKYQDEMNCLDSIILFSYCQKTDKLRIFQNNNLAASGQPRPTYEIYETHEAPCFSMRDPRWTHIATITNLQDALRLASAKGYELNQEY